jgi:hypothetical protein
MHMALSSSAPIATREGWSEKWSDEHLCVRGRKSEKDRNDTSRQSF